MKWGPGSSSYPNDHDLTEDDDRLRAYVRQTGGLFSCHIFDPNTLRTERPNVAFTNLEEAQRYAEILARMKGAEE